MVATRLRTLPGGRVTADRFSFNQTVEARFVHRVLKVWHGNPIAIIFQEMSEPYSYPIMMTMMVFGRCRSQTKFVTATCGNGTKTITSA
jgi:hypothetical protein